MSPDGLNLGDVVRMISGTAFTIALLLGGALLVRKFGLFGVQPGGISRRMRLRESIALDPKRRLVLVQVDDQDHLILLGDGEHVVRSTPALPDPVPVAKAP